MKQKPIFGTHTRKVQPRLRMVANGSSKVNGVRSQTASNLKITNKHDLIKKGPVEPTIESSLRAASVKLKRGSISTPVQDVESSIFVHFTHTKDGAKQEADICHRSAGAVVSRSRENMSTASVPLSELEDLVNDNCIAYIEQGESLKSPVTLNNGDTAAPTISERQIRTTGGHNVLIGVIDAEGFDFAHEDFLDDNGKTRFVSIWDQGSESGPHPADVGKSFDYGREISQKNMNTAIDKSAAFGLPAVKLEPQSQMVLDSHATHVASIAAGNRGVCRNARIVGVLIDIPKNSDKKEERRKSFYDSTRIVHAIDYIIETAEKIKREEGLDELPVSINISLGTNSNAHDGSSALCRWVDAVLTEPGISISVAAGNAGQSLLDAPDDSGFIMGQIHSSGKLDAQGLNVDLEWQVVGNTYTDVSENEMEIWYSPADRFSVSVKPPGEDWLEIVDPGRFIENKMIANGSMVSIYNELYHPINGANYISIYLTPFLSETDVIGVKPGTWKVRLHGTQVRDGYFHAWIERDDPGDVTPDGSPYSYWRFPSFFSETSNVDNSSVSSLACANNVISVANLDAENNLINISSSQGPTRDNRNKPEIAAPGTNIVAAKGFNFDSDELWTSMTGTSMASPYVAGVAGLMLHYNPHLTSAQIRGILQRTAKPLPGATYEWNDQAGYGVIDPEACLDEVNDVYTRRDLE